MKSVRYYDGLLFRLQRKADTIGYNIDHDQDYIAACAAMPSSQYKKAPAEVLPLLYAVGERVESVRRYKARRATNTKNG